MDVSRVQGPECLKGVVGDDDGTRRSESEATDLGREVACFIRGEGTDGLACN